jgi:hypothetical protein
MISTAWKKRGISDEQHPKQDRLHTYLQHMFQLRDAMGWVDPNRLHTTIGKSAHDVKRAMAPFCRHERRNFPKPEILAQSEKSMLNLHANAGIFQAIELVSNRKQGQTHKYGNNERIWQGKFRNLSHNGGIPG